MNILEEVKHHFTESIILISLLQADQLVSDNSTSQLIKLSKSQAVSQVGVYTFPCHTTVLPHQGAWICGTTAQASLHSLGLLQAVALYRC